MAENTQELEEQTDQAEQLVEDDFRALQQQIEALTIERDQFQQQVMRTMADFQNFRKRNEQENIQKRIYATEGLVTALLPVLDNFERTMKHLEGGVSVEVMMDGVRAVERQLRQTLESQNVRRIEAVGQPFNPEEHEAIGFDESSDAAPNTVVTEVEPGYRMGDRVIRPARVKVAGG